MIDLRRGRFLLGKATGGKPVLFNRISFFIKPLPLAWEAVTIALLIPLLQSPAFPNSSIPRTNALQDIDHTEEMVRETMNVDPMRMKLILIDGLMDSAGDDPRALALCKEVIERSTNPASVAIATGGLLRAYQLTGFGPTYREWHIFPSHQQRDLIAGIAREAWQHPDLQVKLAAASVLAGIGDPYRSEGRLDFETLGNSGQDLDNVYETMIISFPENRKAIEFFDRRIRESKSESEALSVLSKASNVATSNSRHIDGRQAKAEWAAVFRSAESSHFAAVQLKGAISLSKLGGSYSREARDFVGQRLRDPLGNDSDNSAKSAAIEIILPLLDSTEARDIRLIKDATRANPEILRYFESLTDAAPAANRGIDRALLAKWKAVARN